MGICECYQLPPQGNFIVGNKYKWDYIIDGIVVKDESKIEISFSEIMWLWYFKNE
jgi:hypothetical protein